MIAKIFLVTQEILTGHLSMFIKVGVHVFRSKVALHPFPGDLGLEDCASSHKFMGLVNPENHMVLVLVIVLMQVLQSLQK